MAVPIGLITSAAGIAGGLLSRQFRKAKGVGSAAARNQSNQAARHNIQLAKSNTANPNASMRDAMAANAQMGADIRGRGMAIDAGLAQRNAERETAFDEKTAGMILQGAGALGGGLTAFTGGTAPGGAGTGDLSQGPTGESVGSSSNPLGAIPGIGAAFSQDQGQAPGGQPSPMAQGGAAAMSPNMASNPQMRSGVRDAFARAIPGMGQVFNAMPQTFTSDEGIKREIRDAGFEVDEFLRALRDRRFQLRETGQEQTGVVAQELEDSQMGREMVSEGPGGVRQVDSSRALQGTMAGLGRVDERLSALERRNQLLMNQLRNAEESGREHTTGTALPISVIEQNPHLRQELRALERFRPGTTDEIARGRIPAGNIEGMREIAPQLFQKFERHLTQTNAGDLPRGTNTPPPQRARPRIQVR